MRVEVLSDHGGQQLNQTAQQLRGAEANLAAWHGSYQDAWQNLQASRRAKPFWKRMFGVSTTDERQALARVQGTWQGVVQADYGRQQIDGRMHQQAAGVHGEDILVWGLSGLDDSWVMLRGYRNRRGETDHVLVGPQGVWAVEVKRRRVRLYVDGDQWWYEKLSARGHVVAREWAVDGGGRTWGRQVTDVAADLAAWLARNGYEVPVHTAVMLMHEQALLGSCDNLTVSVIGTHPAHLVEAIGQYASPLSEQACQEIVALVCRDHRFHNRRRASP
ncbi:nuclease-related domain-containing protein [Actinomycetes bacterium KLBMP 9797]